MRSFSPSTGRVMRQDPSSTTKSSKGMKKRKKRHSRSRSRSRHRSRSYSRGRRDSYEDRRTRGRHYSRSPEPRRRKEFADRDNPKESKCLGIFGMNFGTSQRTVTEMFEKFGPLDGVQIIQDYHTGKSRGFGFVYFKYIEDAIDVSLFLRNIFFSCVSDCNFLKLFN